MTFSFILFKLVEIFGCPFGQFTPFIKFLVITLCNYTAISNYNRRILLWLVQVIHKRFAAARLIGKFVGMDELGTHGVSQSGNQGIAWRRRARSQPYCEEQDAKYVNITNLFEDRFKFENKVSLFARNASRR